MEFNVTVESAFLDLRKARVASLLQVVFFGLSGGLGRVGDGGSHVGEREWRA